MLFGDRPLEFFLYFSPRRQPLRIANRCRSLQIRQKLADVLAAPRISDHALQKAHPRPLSVAAGCQAQRFVESVVDSCLLAGAHPPLRRRRRPDFRPSPPFTIPKLTAANRRNIRRAKPNDLPQRAESLLSDLTRAWRRASIDRQRASQPAFPHPSPPISAAPDNSPATRNAHWETRLRFGPPVRLAPGPGFRPPSPDSAPPGRGARPASPA